MIIELVRPWAVIATGLVLVLLGVFVPTLIVTGLVKSTFLLNVLSYSASVLGVLLGVLGSCLHIGRTRMWEPRFGRTRGRR